MTSESDLHFDIPEEYNEEEYEDILFDREKANPIDMHPIGVDTTYSAKAVSSPNDNSC